MSLSTLAPALRRAELSGATRAGAAALLFVGAADIMFLNGWVFPRLFEAPAGARITVPIPAGDRPAVSVARVPPPEAEVVPARPSYEPLPRTTSRAGSAAAAVPSSPAVAETRMRRLRQVYFPRNVHALDRQDRQALQALANRAAVARATIVIEGHADHTGPEVFNGWLSEQRAVNVADQLAALGVPRDRIQVRHYGSARPAVDGQDRRAMRRNRRVEIGLSEGGTP